MAVGAQGPHDRGAIGVVLLLLLLPLLRGLAPEPPDCARASSRAQRGGRTIVVACETPGPPLRGPSRLLFGQAIDVNRATAGTLEVLPGIGPQRAAAIVRERARRPFERIEALQRVAGIGPRTVERLAGRVSAGRADGAGEERP